MAALSTAPLLAALLRQALPAVAVLDAALAGGGLHPWFPGARCGVAAPAALPDAERALLGRFRQRGAALFGFDPAVDAALLAGAAAAWGGAGDRLVVLGDATDAGAWIAGGAMVLARGGPAPAGCDQVMLLLGAPAPVERLALLLPEGRGAALLAALEAAAGVLARPGWQAGARAISPRLGTFTLLAPALPAAIALAPEEMPRDEVGPGRLRLLLGCLPPRPWRLRARFAPGTPPPRLLLDGVHQAARHQADAGGLLLEASFTPAADAPLVLGLAGQAVPLALEIGP